MFCALVAHRLVGGAVGEIVVLNRMDFITRHFRALYWLQKRFSYNNTKALCVREYSRNHGNRTMVTNTWRFLEVPYLKSKYTYIGDIDVFITESVLHPKRFEQMKEFGLPYSNVVRDYYGEPRRLTGLILIKNEDFYTKELLKAQETVDARGNDEAFLYNIVVEAGLGIPPENSTSP